MYKIPFFPSLQIVTVNILVEILLQMSQEYNIFARTVRMERSYYIHHTIRMCLMDGTKNSNVDNSKTDGKAR